METDEEKNECLIMKEKGFTGNLCLCDRVSEKREQIAAGAPCHKGDKCLVELKARTKQIYSSGFASIAYV